MRLAEWTGRPEGDAPDEPDGWPGVVPIGPGGTDTDGDGLPDTLVTARAAGGAWIFTDLDGDGFADQVLELDPSPDGLLETLIRAVTGG